MYVKWWHSTEASASLVIHLVLQSVEGVVSLPPNSIKSLETVTTSATLPHSSDLKDMVVATAGDKGRL